MFATLFLLVRELFLNGWASRRTMGAVSYLLIGRRIQRVMVLGRSFGTAHNIQENEG